MGSDGRLFKNPMYRMMRLILSRIKRKTLTFIRLLYNIASMNLNIGFIDSIEKWIDKENSKSLAFDCHPMAWYKTFVKECEVFNLDNRIRNRNEFRLFNEIKWCLSKEVKNYYIPNPFIVGQNAIVMSPDRQIFKQLTYPTSGRMWRHSDSLGKVIFPAAKEKVGWYTSLTCPTSYNYFHWMIECLPRLAALEAYIQLFDGIIIPSNPKPFHLESLKALGIGADRLIEAHPKLHLKIEHLFATNYSARDNPAPWLHPWYKEKFIHPLNLKVKPGRRIYISRADASVRNVSNFATVHAMVSSLGFEVLTLSNLSFIEQATLFYESDVIVAEHGASLANLLFCRRGTKVIEIFSVHWIAPCFYAIAKSAGLEYHFYVAESEDICSLVGERIASAAINHTLDGFQSAKYTIDADNLRREILDVINTEIVVAETDIHPTTHSNSGRRENAINT